MTVEFLPSDDSDAVDVEPPAPHRARWWLGGAVVAAALVAWALTRPGPPPVTTPPPVRPLHVTAVPECRGVPDCSTRSGVPPAVARLLRTHLPAGSHVTVRTVIAVDSLTHEDLLVARDIAASVDSTTVRIRIQRGGPTARAILPDPPGIGSLVVHGVNSGFIVRLQYLAPETVPPHLERLRALLHDPRLASV